MTHKFCFATLALCIASISTINAEVEIAPPPREIRPDGTRDPAPNSAVPKAQDPGETVERIIKNSKAVGDKLAMTDTGTETRKTQDVILKDIQSLIDQQENPPKSNQNQDMNKDKNPNDKDKNDKKDMGPMGDMNDMSNQKKDMQPNGGMEQSNMGGDSDQPKGRKPRQQGGDQPKEQGGDPMSQSKNPGGKNDMGKQAGAAPQNPKQGKGRLPDPLSKGDLPPPMPSIPPEETVMKDVWGYLPDKLRQQAMQYYTQEFMPRYEKLLEHYYSSLADKKNKK